MLMAICIAPMQHLHSVACRWSWMPGPTRFLDAHQV